MMKYLIIFFALASLTIQGQNNIVSGEYWFDNNLLTKAPITFSPSQDVEFVADLPVATLLNGLHTLHLRFKDDNGIWSPVVSRFFVKFNPQESTAENNMAGYEFWFDSDYAGKQYIASGSSKNLVFDNTVQVASLANGLHTIHFRAKDDKGEWSPVVSRFFVKFNPQENTSENNMAGYEFWFDSDYGGKQYIASGSSKNLVFDNTVQVASLANGLHTIHFRAKDGKGEWSPVVSRFFIKNEINQGGGMASLIGYEFWFGSDYNTKQFVAVEQTQSLVLDEQTDVGALKNGLNTIHFRIKDSKGLWSPVVSRMFVKTGSIEDQGENTITALEYWFDHDVDNLKKLPVSPEKTVHYLDNVDVSGLFNGLHTLTYRFKDARGAYSSAVSRFIIKKETGTEITDSKVVAYRYWVDDLLMVERSISEPARNLVFADSVDMRMIWAGDYMLHMQFKDELGRWSSVVSDTVKKNPFIYALLATNKPTGCEGDTIVFTADVVDADSLVWEFEGGIRDTGFVAPQRFDSEGSYAVSAKAFNTSTGDASTIAMDKDLLVYANPEIVLEDSVVLTDRESFTLDAGEGFAAYFWNDVAGSQNYLISGSEAGEGTQTLTLRVENEHGCSASDTIFIRIKSTVAAEGIKISTVKMFPNPFTDNIRIEWDNNGIETYRLIVVDVTGTVVARREGITSGSVLVLDQMPSGTYFVVLEHNKHMVSVPVIKK